MLWLFLIGLAAGFLIYKVRKAHSFWENKGINYVRPKFFFGIMNLLLQKKSFIQITDDLYKHFPNDRYHGVYQFLTPILLVKDPDLIKQIAVKQFDHFVDHQQLVNPETDALFSGNLIALNGDEWRDMRATLSPSFTSSKMKSMFFLINECAQYFAKYFEESQNSSDVHEYEMKDILTRYTNDVIASTAFGLKCDSLKNKTNDFYLMGREMTNFKGLKGLKIFAYFISPTLANWLKVKIISDKVGNYFSSIIKNTINTREKNNIVRPDMIHLLMEAQKGRAQQEEKLNIDEGFSTVEESTAIQSSNKKRQISMDDIISQAMIFFFAGFDTVSTLLSFLFYELAVSPEVQVRLREELFAADGEITYEQLLSMKYLDMVVSEALRKWPPPVFTDRKVTKPFTIQPEKPNEKPLHLTLNSVVWLPMYSLQRDPKYYPEPEKFIPERFSDENKHKINPSTYIPFGIGPRNCIGSRFALLECKLLVYHVLKSFEIAPVKRTRIPMVLSKNDLNLSPEGGMWLGFKKINNK